MREILFRGKRVSDGEWVEGFYAYHKDCWKDRETHRIYKVFCESDCGDFYPDWYEVDPTTIGQYTGLTDKNGKRIFEGDVVRRKIDSVESRCCYEIRWNNSFTGYWYYRCSSFMSMMNESCRVVGNIHDNPELLEETL